MDEGPTDVSDSNPQIPNSVCTTMDKRESKIDRMKLKEDKCCSGMSDDVEIRHRSSEIGVYTLSSRWTMSVTQIGCFSSAVPILS